LNIKTPADDQPIRSRRPMPMVVGMLLDTAAAVISSAITDPDIVIEHQGAHMRPNVVTAQRPLPGTQLEHGSQVTLTVSARP
jgi:beta-lactam-binding protein with PASTA domain